MGQVPGIRHHTTPVPARASASLGADRGAAEGWFRRGTWSERLDVPCLHFTGPRDRLITKVPILAFVGTSGWVEVLKGGTGIIWSASPSS